ncbi:MAG: metal transporter [Bauldia sp.]
MVANRLWLLVPIAAVAAVIAYLLLGRPLADLTASAPPVEALAVDAVRLTPGEIALSVRADGSAPLTIAQVQVDAAWRSFTAEPSATIGRLKSALVRIPYPWIEGETHHVVFLTSTGVSFEHTIDVAVPAPEWRATSVWELALVGVLLGIVPVAIGLLSYPALRSLGPGGLRFILALTIGLLLYLFIDTLHEGLEHGAETLDRLRGTTAVWVTALLTALALVAVGRRRGAPEGMRLAVFIALGIGLHNLGEGLVVGAALATGSAALATFLVVGFVIHNVTEGVGIAAPVATGARPPLATFVGLAALAGLPALAGVFLGVNAVSPYWTAIAFGVGAGAILQVIIEVAAFLARRDGAEALARPAGAAGIVAGLAIMYATALLV